MIEVDGRQKTGEAISLSLSPKHTRSEKREMKKKERRKKVCGIGKKTGWERKKN